MKQATIVAIMAIADADPARNSRDRAEIMRALGLDVPVNEIEPTNKLLSFSDAAALLNRTPRSLHQLARRGLLRKARLPGGTRCSGVLRSDVEKLLATMGGVA